MIKAIFFDFDLTLVNSTAGAKATYYGLWKKAGLKTSKKGYQQYVGSRFKDVVEDLHEKSGMSKKKIIDEFNKLYIKKIPKMKFLAKGLFYKLKNVKKMIITNNNRTAVEAACKYFGIKYDKLIADDNMAKDERKHDAILKNIKKLGIKKSEAMYVGDHVNDVKEAYKAGIKSVIVPTGVFKKLYIKRYNPDFMISSLKKLPKLIK